MHMVRGDVRMMVRNDSGQWVSRSDLKCTLRGPSCTSHCEHCGWEAGLRRKIKQAVVFARGDDGLYRYRIPRTESNRDLIDTLRGGRGFA